MGMRAPQQPPPQEKPPGLPQGPQDAAPDGDVTKLLVQVNSGLNQLASLIDRSPLPDEDKSQFGQIMMAFNQFAEGLGQPQDQKQPEPKGPPGQVPMETAGRPSMPAM